MKLEFSWWSGCGKQASQLTIPMKSDTRLSVEKSLSVSSVTSISTTSKHPIITSSAPDSNSLFRPTAATTPTIFRKGDRVKIAFPKDVVEKNQSGHGGWTKEMIHILNKIGTFVAYSDDKMRTCEVKYFHEPRHYYLNSALLTLVKSDPTFKEIKAGDIIRVTSDEEEVKLLHRRTYGYVSDMRSCLGSLAYVKNILTDGSIQALSPRGTYIWSKYCVRLVTETELEDVKKQYQDDRTFKANDVVLILGKCKSPSRIKFGVVKGMSCLVPGEVIVKIVKKIASVKSECLIKVIPTQMNRVWTSPKYDAFITKPPGTEKPRDLSISEISEQIVDALNKGDIRQLHQLQNERQFYSAKKQLDMATLMQLSCQANQLPSVQWLVRITNKFCIYVREQNDRFGQQAIHFAAACTEPHILQYLLTLGADSNSPSQHGTPLEIAIRSNCSENVSILLEQGAAVASAQAEQKTAHSQVSTTGAIPIPLLHPNPTLNLPLVCDSSWQPSTSSCHNPLYSDSNEAAEQTAADCENTNPSLSHNNCKEQELRHTGDSKPVPSRAVNQRNSLDETSLSLPNSSSLSSSCSSTSALSLQDPNDEDIRKKVECIVCMSSHFQVLFQCGHGTCLSCSKHLQTCPVCRAKINQRITIYGLVN